MNTTLEIQYHSNHPATSRRAYRVWLSSTNAETHNLQQTGPAHDGMVRYRVVRPNLRAALADALDYIETPCTLILSDGDLLLRPIGHKGGNIVARKTPRGTWIASTP